MLTAWYTIVMTALANNQSQDVSLDLSGVIKAYEDRDAMRKEKWRERFSV